MILEVFVKMVNQFDEKHPILYSCLFYDREEAMLEVMDWCLHDRRTNIKVLGISMTELNEDDMRLDEEQSEMIDTSKWERI